MNGCNVFVLMHYFLIGEMLTDFKLCAGHFTSWGNRDAQNKIIFSAIMDLYSETSMER